MVSELRLGRVTSGRELSEDRVSRLSGASAPPELYPYGSTGSARRV